MTAAKMQNLKRLTRALVLATGIALAAPISAFADCTTPAGVAGDIAYGTNNVMAYCNGTSWVAMGSGASFGTLTAGSFCTATSGTSISCTTSGINLASQVTGILPLANGGTGTSTAFTAGSVVFAGASGVYTQDNANFFWDGTNHRLGIGTTTPAASLDLSNVTGALALPMGTTGTRPTGVNGMIRYNSSMPGLEAYINGAWQSLMAAGTSGTSIGTGTANYVARWLGTSTLGTGSLYDDGTKVGVGTATPTAGLTVNTTTAFPYGTDLTTTGAQSAVAIGTNTSVRYSGSAAATWYGIAAGVSGQVVYLTNASSYVLTLSNQSTSETTAANRIVTGTNADLSVAAGAAVVLQYDGTAALWRVLGGSGSGASGSGSVQGLSIVGTVASSTAAIFNVSTVVTNTLLGSAPTTSQITVPSAGAYLLSTTVTVCGGTAAYSSAYIYVNGTATTTATANANQCDSGTAVQFKVLSAGDVISGRCSDNNGRSATCAFIAVKMDGGSSASLSGGTTNYVTKWTGTSTVGTSVLYDDGTNVGVGTTSPTAKMTIAGTTAFPYGTDLTTTGAQSAVAIGTATSVRYSGSAAATWYGIAAGVSGQVVYLTNASSSTLTLSNQSTSETTAANRIITGTSADLAVAAGSAVVLQYDGTAARWRVLGGSGSSSGGGGSSVWVNFNGSTGAIRSSSGVSSVTRNSGGDYTVTLSTAQPDANYAVLATCDYSNTRGDAASSHNVWISGYPATTTTFNLHSVAGTTYYDCATVSAAVFSSTTGGGSASLSGGTANYLTKWTSATAVGTSVLYDNGTNVGVGTTSPTAKMTVAGTTAFPYGADLTTTGAQSAVAIGTATSVRYNGSATATWYGIAAGVSGQVVYLTNASSYTLALANQSASETTAANRIITGTSADISVVAGASVTLQYDGTAARWRVMGASNSSSDGTNNTMVSGIPDAIQCLRNDGQGSNTFYLGNPSYSSSPTVVSYIEGYFGTNIAFNRATGNYVSCTAGPSNSICSFLSTSDCLNTSQGLSRLYAQGRAFNFAKGPAAQWLQNGTTAYYNAGSVGIGTNSTASSFGVYGNMSVGTSYIGTAAPTGGAIIEGNVGIGTSAPTAKMTVAGTTAFPYGADLTTTGAQSAVAIGTATSVRYSGSAAATWYGIAAGVSGQIVYLTNASSSTLTLSNQSTSETTAANRVITGTSADLPIAAGASVTLQYDGTAARWRVMGGSGGSGSGSSGTTWVMIASTDITTAATSYTFSGLNGDSDGEYQLVTRVVSGLSATTFVQPNGDSTSANYGTAYVYGASSGASGTAYTGAQGMLICAVNSAALCYGTSSLYAKSGYVRTLTASYAQNVSGVSVSNAVQTVSSWNNTASNITSITIASNATNGLGVGTRLELWTKRSVGGSSSGTPAGSSTQVQYNDSGAFAANANFTWDNTNKLLTVGTGAATPTATGTSGTVSSFVMNVIPQAMTLNTVTASGVTVNAATAGQMAYYSGTSAISGTPNLYVSGTNIGIGTTTPLEALEVAGTMATLVMNRQITPTSGQQIGSIKFNGGNATATTSDINYSMIQGLAISSTANSESGAIAFLTKNAGTLAERVRIDNAGKVGIGTTSPSATLDVNGTVRPQAATLGAACSPLGAQAYNSLTGAPMYCSSGAVWAAPSGSGGGLTQGTAVATTSGTSVDFSAIPSTAKRITILFYGVSLNSSGDLLVQVGTGGSPTTSGYVSGSGNVDTNVALWPSSAGCIIHTGAAARGAYGLMTLVNVSGNTWACSGSLYNTVQAVTVGGGVSLSGTLNMVRITTSTGTDTFDAGTVNIMWE